MTQLQFPKTDSHVNLTCPAPKVLQIAINRPARLNAMNQALTQDLERVIEWFEKEPSLWVLIITGTGRAFCAGQDLKDWHSQRQGTDTKQAPQRDFTYQPNGFGSISRRRFTKPVIAAVNGVALGGGSEMVVNCDIVIAAESARFGFPEVKRGVYAAAGGIYRLQALCGHIKASELLLTGRIISSKEAKAEFNMVNEIVADNQLATRAVQKAVELTQASPDSIRATKAALDDQLYAGDAGLENVYARSLKQEEVRALYLQGGNIDEGLKAFNEKRDPSWRNPAPLSAIYAAKL